MKGWSLLSLLQAASRGVVDLKLADLEGPGVRWAVETGLGPLLARCTAGDPLAAASPDWRLLKGADLTARVLSAEQVEAMEEIIDTARERSLTLLKGISLCEQVYPEPHLRPMRDIDFLVDEDAAPAVESALVGLGYRQRSQNLPGPGAGHHHPLPFVHSRSGIWVEVHRALFPRRSALASGRLFSIDNIKANLEPSSFRGRPVNRLSPELEVIYLACHWASSFKAIRGVGGMVTMLDLIYYLKRMAIRWEQVLERVEGSPAGRHLYLLLSYLAKHRLIELPSGWLRELSRKQRAFGALNLRLAHAVIDRYAVEGRGFGGMMSPRNIKILWNTLLLPGPPLWNLLLVPWNLGPSRSRSDAG